MAIISPTPPVTSDLDLEQVLATLAEVEETIATLRLQVAQAAGQPLPSPGTDASAAAATVGATAGVEIDTELRALKFLKAFYDAPGRALTAAQTSAAAKAAGYDPRGTAGFYVGNGCLKRVDESRVLTQVGREWYEANSPQYAVELGVDATD